MKEILGWWSLSFFLAAINLNKQVLNKPPLLCFPAVVYCDAIGLKMGPNDHGSNF
jgi:hypothetical protein